MWSSKRKRMLENENRQGDMSILREADIGTFIKPSDKDHVEIMQNQRNAKQTETRTKEGKRERGRTRQRQRDEVEEDLNIMGIKTGRQ